MSRAEPVTQEAVFSAADALAAQNMKPTLETIRNEVGGSYNTLSPLLKAWRNQQSTQVAAVLDMPDAVLSHVKAMTGELWKVASAEASARTQSIEEAAEQRARDAEEETGELSTAVSGLESELVAAHAALERATSEKEVLAATLATRTEEATRATAELAAIRDMLEKSNTRNDQLQQELIALARDVAGKKKGA